MEIRYYSKDIEKFIFSLDKRLSADIDRLIMLLYTYGSKVKMPYSKSLKGGLFELRKAGKKQIRVIYCFHKNEAVILHILEKKGNALPIKDLLLAKQRRNSLA